MEQDFCGKTYSSHAASEAEQVRTGYHNFDRLSQVEKDIRAKRYVMFQISGVAVIGNMPEDHPTEIAGIPLVAAGDYVVEYLCREWVDEVFVNLPLQSAQLDDLVRQLNEMGITVHIQLADKLMVGTQRQFVERLGGYTVLTTSINTISTGELFVKRLFDIIGGLVGCVLTGILFLFLAPAIKIQSPGPVFFSQIRVGKTERSLSCTSSGVCILTRKNARHSLPQKTESQMG